MNNFLLKSAKHLFLPIFLSLISNCTVRTLYLSATDHLNSPVKPTCEWEHGKTELAIKHSVDSLILTNQRLQSLLVIRNDTIQFEWYKKGFTESTAHNIKSATKSVVSLLTGIAIDNGYLTLDTELKNLFSKTEMDSLTGKVTIRDLLTMHGGFPYTEYSYYWMICSSLNPIKSTLHQRRKIEPNDSSEYSNISANLLGYAVAKATNMKLEEFANKFLFSPLGIHYHAWANDLRGNNACAGDLFLCPRDLAKIGYLMLKKGKLNGKQIVSENWVQESTSKKTIVKDFPSSLDYGYLWWLDNKHTPGAFCAIGSGGQILYVSPIDNTIIIATSTLTASGWPIVLEIIRKVIKLNNRSRPLALGGPPIPVAADNTGKLVIPLSDKRAKKSIVQLSNALEKVMKLRSVTFKWKEYESKNKSIGLIAQEVEKVFPELVYTNNENGMKGIHYAELTSVLIEAIKEQQAQIAGLSKIIGKERRGSNKIGKKRSKK
jgi:CubicO group peptidase (beta-lactamase class C family)